MVTHACSYTGQADNFDSGSAADIHTLRLNTGLPTV